MDQNFNFFITNMDTKNLSIVRQTFANTVFTHKVQEIACERQEKYALYVKKTNIWLVSIVLIMLVFQLIYKDNLVFSYIGVAITIAEMIFLIIQLSFDFDQKAILHKNSALKYMWLRDCYRMLITDIMNNSINSKEINDKRDLLQREYQVISDLSPQTNNDDYKNAQIKLNKKWIVENEDFTWSDEEINRFLPQGLHIKQ